MSSPSDSELRELAYLRTPQAIRERAGQLYARGVDGRLRHFDVDESKLDAIVARVVAVTNAAYPDVHAIPYHSRWRHFHAGGVDRVAALAWPRDPEERLRSKIELVVTSVLLDAGAGEHWTYREVGGATYARSEGLAVASFHLFSSGTLSSRPLESPLRADADVLARLPDDTVGAAFQIRSNNPLIGIAGRAALLRKLGETVRTTPSYFGSDARLGNFGTGLSAQAVDAMLPARAVLDAVLRGFGAIWPGREILAGEDLGDVWTHPDVGRVPFHKLSQWLTYSVCESLEEDGVTITGWDELTGLAEYRNGGLFLDGGVIVARDPLIFQETHPVSSSVVVEWRGLTVALLDRVAARTRAALGLSVAELPLAKVLEGGTWRAGRELAREKRANGGPPLRVHSDGTVF